MDAKDELNPILKPLLQFVVGLVGIRKNGSKKTTIAHLGSGMLVEIAGVCGILTAGHVVEELLNYETFGFVSFEGIGDHVPLKTFPRDFTRTIILGRDFEVNDGPDLGFVILPPDIKSWIRQTRAFYSVDKRLQDFDEVKERRAIPLQYVLGVIGENSEIVETSDNRTTFSTQMFASRGWPLDVWEHESFTYFTFKLAENGEPARPSSYGGISGGPIWGLSEDVSVDTRLLVGVAYRQSDVYSDGTRTLTCHGPNGIYEQLFLEIQKSFPDVFD